MAVLEIPELEAQLQQDDAAIKNASDQVTHAAARIGPRGGAAQSRCICSSTRLDSVAKSKPGLVAQQEVDDAQGKDLAAEAQVEAAKSSVRSGAEPTRWPRRPSGSTTRCCSIIRRSPRRSPAW